MSDYHCTTREALRLLFAARPNERVRAAEVCAVMGRTVSRTAISRTARALYMDGEFVIASSHGRVGYVSCVVVEADIHDVPRCQTCELRQTMDSPASGKFEFCTLAARRITLVNWCGGHREKVAP